MLLLVFFLGERKKHSIQIFFVVVAIVFGKRKSQEMENALIAMSSVSTSGTAPTLQKTADILNIEPKSNEKARNALPYDSFYGPFRVHLRLHDYCSHQRRHGVPSDAVHGCCCDHCYSLMVLGHGDDTHRHSDP